MAHNLADELLQMVLSDSLRIPDEEFRRPSTRAFARLDPQFASSSSVLLVCKRWLRVATPLLYEVVVIRSVGQAQALADAFVQNPPFALHVKKIRIEGAWDSLGEILKRCINTRILFLALHIWSNDSIGGLCRGLSRINPAEVIVCDEEKLYNAKMKKVVRGLCDAIPKWTKLTKFHLPVMSGKPLVQLERSALGLALYKSTTLRRVSADMPGLWSPIWSTLLANPNLTLDFYCWIWPEIGMFQESVPCNLRSRVRIMDHPSRWRPRIENRPRPRQTAASSSFRPLASASRQDAAKIWRIIFAFVTLPSSNFYEDSGHGAFLNAVRINLSLVCSLFEQTVRPFFYHTPLFTNQTSFTLFVRKVYLNPSLGLQVRELPYNFVIARPKDADDALCCLLPRLPNLRHFTGDNKMSFAAFQTLAQSAGQSLLSLDKLRVEGQGVRESPAVWNSFTSLKRLGIVSFPNFELDEDAINMDCLSHVHTLSVSVYAPNLFELLCLMPFPNLTTLNLEYVPTGPAAGQILSACGANITELYLWGGDTADVFHHCPNLTTLKWMPEMGICISLLYGFNSHDKLKKLVILKHLNEKSCKSDDISGFFSTLDFSGFPSLRELALPYYRWPREEREITRARMPRWALQLKDKFGVVITAESGRAWRPRVQRRR